MTKADIQTQLECNIDPATIVGTPVSELEMCARYAVEGFPGIAYDVIEEWIGSSNDLDQVRQYINRAAREADALEQVPA